MTYDSVTYYPTTRLCRKCCIQTENCEFRLANMTWLLCTILTIKIANCQTIIETRRRHSIAPLCAQSMSCAPPLLLNKSKSLNKLSVHSSDVVPRLIIYSPRPKFDDSAIFCAYVSQPQRKSLHRLDVQISTGTQRAFKYSLCRTHVSFPCACCALPWLFHLSYYCGFAPY